MPAIKAAKVQERRRVVNRRVRSATRTAVKKALRALSGGEEQGEAVRLAASRLDRAVTKGVMHRNAAARGKSRLMKRLNAASAAE